MATPIYIKKSTANAIPAALANGELAYSNVSQGLFVGMGGAIYRIGGIYNFGVLTANQALVTNSTSGINNILTANIGITGSLTANGSLGSLNQVLTSNSTGGIFWSSPGAASVNSAAQYTWSNTHTFSVNTIFSASVSVGNTTVNAVVNSTSIAFSGGNTINGTTYGGQAASVANGGVSAANGLISNTSGLFANIGSGLTIATGAIAVNNVLSLQDLTLTGNLIVQGTTVAIDTTTLQVKDNMIVLADQQANTGSFLDAVDTGWFVQTGNTSVNYYSGLARIAASSSNTMPVFKLFSTVTAPNNTVINATATIGQLISYINAGGLVTNSSVVNITANSSLSVALVANSLTLTTALAGTSGGTGKNTVSNNALLYGNSTNGYNELALGTDGYVLQANATALTYGPLDGGVF